MPSIHMPTYAGEKCLWWCDNSWWKFWPWTIFLCWESSQQYSKHVKCNWSNNTFYCYMCTILTDSVNCLAQTCKKFRFFVTHLSFTALTKSPWMATCYVVNLIATPGKLEDQSWLASKHVKHQIILFNNNKHFYTVWRSMLYKEVYAQIDNFGCHLFQYSLLEWRLVILGQR